MARTIQETALLLEAIAGLDPVGRDARQPPNLASLPVPRYSALATGEVSGVRVGVLREGLENCEEDVKEATWAAAEGLRKAGAVVEEVSIPMHRDSAAVWLPLCLEGGHANRMEGERGFRGFYPLSLSQAYFRGFRMQAAELSCTNKYYILFGEYVRETYGNQYYQKCQNLVPALTQAYDEILVNQGFDVLLLPTLPIKPQLLPKAGMTPAEVRLLPPSLPPSLLHSILPSRPTSCPSPG
jgi:amidase